MCWFFPGFVLLLCININNVKEFRTEQWKYYRCANRALRYFGIQNMKGLFFAHFHFISIALFLAFIIPLITLWKYSSVGLQIESIARRDCWCWRPSRRQRYHPCPGVQECSVEPENCYQLPICSAVTWARENPESQE